MTTAQTTVPYKRFPIKKLKLVDHFNSQSLAFDIKRASLLSYLSNFITSENLISRET